MAAPAVEPTAEPTAERLIARRAPMLSWGPAGLLMEGVSLDAIAEALGTPSWVIGAATIRARYRQLDRALRARGIGPGAIHYAIKANDHRAVLRLMSGLGAGADAVSAGEIERALEAGIAPARVVFSGVGKTGEELRRAVSLGVGQINVESREELRELGAIARGLGRVQSVAIRVNPDIDAGAHDKISTGRAADKFGVAMDEAVGAYREAASLDGLRPVGLAAHIGSQIMTGEPFALAGRRLASLVRDVRASGLPVETVDIGGGLGISYGDGPDGDPEVFASAVGGSLDGLEVRVTVEPGRWLVGPAGLLLSRAVRVKAGVPASFLILDAAMNDLLRPSLYEAWHGIVPVASASDETQTYDVVGPVCESGDVLARGRLLPVCRAGDLMAILDAGAYGAVMSSTYNARPLAAAAMTDAGCWSVIRPRQPIEALWRDEVVPDFVAR